MAWTSVGGVILPVETLAVEGGKGELKLTGSLGKVMTESAQAAFTLLKTKKIGSGADPEFFNKHDFHIHVPDGATPKDGPSAGITISLALASLLSGKPLIKQLAMTGEITLQGRVTAIGGVREKLVGAIRAGITSILLPEENRKDFVELPLYIRQKLSVVFVKSLDEAMKYAFGEVKFPPPEEK
jgi:ATP-dependent Lon protease